MLSKAFLYLIILAVSVTAAIPPTKRATCSGGRTTANKACCVWFDVLDDIQENLFSGGDCGDEARESLRLIFHDAIAWSPALIALGQGGGADGSIMAHTDVEMQDPVNNGLDEIIEAQRPFALKHKVSFGDFIQFAGAVGVANCNGGPQIQFFAGRSNESRPAPPGLVPQPTDSVAEILLRIGDAGFLPVQLVWMLVSHTIASQKTTDPSIPGAPFDSTPKDFDAQFFVETMLKGTFTPGQGLHSGEALSPYPGEFRLQSDARISRDGLLACEWQDMIMDRGNMLQKFELTVLQLSLLGFDQSMLTDCSDVIPIATGTVADPFLPAGMSMDDIEASCIISPFPSLSAVPGPVTSLSPV
ncbi:manganese peroxidase [Cubamyces menziesii]|nr:manganese peroxidase [Cubamyces menziesii]